MLNRLASWIRLTKFTAGLIWRNLESQYLVRRANRRQGHLDLIMACVGHGFMEINKKVTGVGCHTQPRPGYCVQGTLRTSEICWEAPVCLTVYYEGKPLVGMALEFRGSALCIRQMQGAPNTRIPEDLRAWPKLFVSGMKLFVRNTKEITSLRIYSADQRPSYKYPTSRFSDEELKIYQQNLRRRYDGTARQSGFKKANSRYWVWRPQTQT